MAEIETAAPSLDDETTAALTLFNEYVDADRERTRREKRIKKAERAKDEAAAAVRNAKGAEQTAAAEAAYREAQDTFRKLRDGEEPETSSADDPPADDAGEQEAPAVEASTDEPPVVATETDRTDDDAEDAAEDPTPSDSGEEQ